MSISISSGKNAGLWRVKPFGAVGRVVGLRVEPGGVVADDGPAQRLHLRAVRVAGTLPHGDKVAAEQGSTFGKDTTCCVGPVNSSAAFGARTAYWMPPRNDSESSGFQVNRAFQVPLLPAVLKSEQR